MMQHHHYEIGVDDYGDVYDIVIRDNCTIIAVLSRGEGPAQHLVRAGNCHDELLEALKTMVHDWVADWPFKYAGFEIGPHHAITKARAAIAKAEGNSSR